MVFVCTADTPKGSMYPSYSVTIRSSKTAVVQMRGSNVTVTMDRIKPSYIITDEDDFSASTPSAISMALSPNAPAKYSQDPSPYMMTTNTMMLRPMIGGVGGSPTGGWGCCVPWEGWSG